MEKQIFLSLSLPLSIFLDTIIPTTIYHIFVSGRYGTPVYDNHLSSSTTYTVDEHKYGTFQLTISTSPRYSPLQNSTGSIDTYLYPSPFASHAAEDSKNVPMTPEETLDPSPHTHHNFLMVRFVVVFSQAKSFADAP